MVFHVFDSIQNMKIPAVRKLWFICDMCDDWYCSTHNMHVCDCRCPPIEECDYDPRNGENMEMP
jgi:hypothetical protein